MLFPSFHGPPVVVEGKGSWLTADDGRRLLDAVAGPSVHALGHSHPRIIDALEYQSRRLIQSSFRLNGPTVALAEKLVELAGPPFSRVFLANTGSQAVEAAVTLALKHANGRDGRAPGLLALEGCHHGRSGLALTLDARQGGAGLRSDAPAIVHMPLPAQGDGRTEMGQALDALRNQGRNLVAVIAEPVLGVGGVITPPVEVFRALRTLCDEHLALLIFDEVFTGLGRTGTLFAYDALGVVPDILVLGKALGGGLPIGAVLAPDETVAAWEPYTHSNTFGANTTLAAAAGLAVIEEVTRAGLPAAATAHGQHLVKALTALSADHPRVRDVRGRGLLIGIELTSAEAALALVEAFLDERVLTAPGGRNTVRFTPPLNMTGDDVDFLLEAARRALGRC